MKSTPSTRTEPGRLRRLITRTLLTIGLTIGGIATTATAAEAANSVYGCFRSADGTDLWSMTARLQYWTGAGWATVTTSQLGPLGALVPGYSCVGWTVPQEYIFTVFVDHRLNPSSFPWWWGSPYTGVAWGPWQSWYNFGIPYAVPGDHTWVLFGNVTCYGCA
jgi:hypothetical protein